MRYLFTHLLAVALSVAAASAQDLTQIPQCAQAAALKSITTTKCTITDFKCICNNQAWLSSLLPDVQKNCSPDDLKKTEDYAQKLCAAQSVTLTFATSTGTPTATGTSTGTAKSTATGTGTGTGVQATSTATSASAAAKPSSNVGYSAQKRSTGALLGMLGVAFGMAAWC